jgi:ribosomal protein L7/L12
MTTPNKGERMDTTALMTAALTLLEIAKNLIGKREDREDYDCFHLANTAANWISYVMDEEYKKPQPSEIGPVHNYIVNLLSYGDKKIQCIKLVREYTHLGLKEAKELVESASCHVLETTDADEAFSLYIKLNHIPDFDPTNADAVCELYRDCHLFRQTI